MCSISASKDKNLLLKLVDLNRYRGEESHSVSQFLYTDDGLDLKSQTKSYGPLDIDLLDGNWDYCVVHQQAPTSKEVNNTDLAIGRFIHPAKKDNSFLWHNGIIKDDLLYASWYADGTRVFDISDPKLVIPPKPPVAVAKTTRSTPHHETTPIITATNKIIVIMGI